MKHVILFFLFCTVVFAEDPHRIIAILENERLLEAEPDIRLGFFLSSSDAEIRARAVLAAARIGNKALLRELAGLTTDKSVEVRKLLAFALGQIRSKEGLPTALLALKDGDLEVRRLAIEAIGRIGGIEATEFVLPFLNEKDVALREQAALALALIKDKASVDVLIEKASRDDPAQWSYVYALYRLGDERALPVLHRTLANPSASPSTGEPSSLLFALKALWSMKKPLTPEEMDRLLQHSDPRVQVNTLDVLAVSSDQSACAVIDKHFESFPRLSKWKAIETMGALNCPARIDLKEENVNLRGAALQAHAKLKKEEALPALQAASSDASWIIRWRVAQALANLNAESALPLLKTLMKDLDKAVELAALDSLTNLLPQTADLFVELLRSPDFAERATAADALGKTKDREYLPLLLEAYRASSDPAEIEGRVAILDVLADYNTSEVLKLYEEALSDPEYTIRRHAVDGIKKLVGSQFYRQGKIKDPEEFLYRSEKVSKTTAAKYPADYGMPVPELVAEMALEKGKVVIRLLSKEAPVHVLNFKRLAEKGFYNGLRIHRVVPNFVVQGGDPRGDGWGGAGDVIHDEMNLRVYKRGMVGMPLAGKDTGGSQFFITHSRQPHLDGNYTIFGEVLSGMDVIDNTEIGDRILSVQIKPL